MRVAFYTYTGFSDSTDGPTPADGTGDTVEAPGLELFERDDGDDDGLE